MGYIILLLELQIEITASTGIPCCKKKYISVYTVFRISLSSFKERYTFSKVYRLKLPEDKPRKLVLFGADLAACNEAALQMH